MTIEKVINKVGPIAAMKLGPVVIPFLAANPWLIPVVIAGGAGLAALIEKPNGGDKAQAAASADAPEKFRETE